MKALGPLTELRFKLMLLLLVVVVLQDTSQDGEDGGELRPYQY